MVVYVLLFYHPIQWPLKAFVASQSEITRRLEESAGSKTQVMNCKGSGLLQRSEITDGEHPLSLGKTSIWNQYFQVLL